MSDLTLRKIDVPDLGNTYYAPQLDNTLATAFSTVSTYAVGDLVVYNRALYRCTTAVTTAGAWNASNWTAVAMSDELSSLKQDFAHIQSAMVTDTASGSIASFTDGADGVPMESLVVNIEPVQDLNGQDAPYPAGGGKNKVNITATTSTVNDVTFTVNGDGSVTVSGTASANAIFNLTGNFDLEAGTYTLSGCPSGGGNDSYRLDFYYNNNTESSIDTGSGATFTVSETITGYVRIRIQSGAQVSKTFWPQIESGSSTTTYAPYENICPISGWTSVDTMVCGVNVWDEEWENGYYDPSSGASADGNNVRSKNFIDVLPNTSYFLKSAGNAIVFLWYDADKNFISYVQTVDQAKTSPSNARYAKFYMNLAYGTTYNNDISINYPATDTSYHSGADNQTYTTQLGQTVYGGTLDVVSGTGAESIIGVDLGTLNWTRGSFSGHYRFYTDAIAGIKPATDDNTVGNVICSHYKTNSVNNMINLDNVIAISSSGRLFVFDSTLETYTAAQFKTAMSGITACYELATPTTLSVTGQTVSSLYGDNNVFSDAGSVSVTYTADLKKYIAKVVANS